MKEKIYKNINKIKKQYENIKTNIYKLFIKKEKKEKEKKNIKVELREFGIHFINALKIICCIFYSIYLILTYLISFIFITLLLPIILVSKGVHVLNYKINKFLNNIIEFFSLTLEDTFKCSAFFIITTYLLEFFSEFIDIINIKIILLFRVLTYTSIAMFFLVVYFLLTLILSNSFLTIHEMLANILIFFANLGSIIYIGNYYKKEYDKYIKYYSYTEFIEKKFKPFKRYTYTKNNNYYQNKNYKYTFTSTLESALKIFSINKIDYDNRKITKFDIKKIYKKLVKENHPDNNRKSKIDIKDINNAYEYLCKNISF